MPDFKRSFATEMLTAWDATHRGNAVKLLFDRWALPGQEATDEKPLRLAVRGGYLNFYVKGQSVAKLSLVRNVPRLEVHEAYVTGRVRGTQRENVPAGKDYRRYDAEALADPTTAALFSGWIDTALTHAATEKRFVDDVVAANPGVIDLEMGLPASDLPGGERAAPRMDLVIAQVDGDAPASIAFWEAKCANNGELRSRKTYEDHGPDGFTGPKVLNQVRKYVRWMEVDGRITRVSGAYRDTAKALSDLHGMFRGNAEGAAECISIWRRLKTDAPAIVVQPGIVIGNYWPEGDPKPEAKDGEMAQCAATFARNGHREELERNGARIHEVGPDHEGPTLPLLLPVEVSA